MIKHEAIDPAEQPVPRIRTEIYRVQTAVEPHRKDITIAGDPYPCRGRNNKVVLYPQNKKPVCGICYYPLNPDQYALTPEITEWLATDPVPITRKRG